MYEGLRKSAHGVEFRPGLQSMYLTGTIGFYLLPLLVLPFGFWVGSDLLIGLGAFALFALFAKHVVFARAIRMSPWYGLLFPLAAGYYAVLLTSSLAGGLRGQPVVWKGRTYAMDAGPPSAGPSQGNR
jgi:hypothetical protein